MRTGELRPGGVRTERPAAFGAARVLVAILGSGCPGGAGLARRGTGWRDGPSLADGSTSRHNARCTG